MSKITEQIARDVNAELDRIAGSGETALAQAIRDKLGPARMWSAQTVEVVRREERLGCDGRAG